MLLLLFELLVARREDVWSIQPRSSSGVVDEIEANVLGDAPPPCVLALGSSRIRDAVAPLELESALGLPRGAVLNVAVTAGTPFDASLLFRRNAELLGAARVVIVGVEDWYVNDAIAPTERDWRFASVRERFHYGEHSLRMLVGWAWSTYGASEAILRYARNRGRPGQHIPVLSDGRLDWAQDGPTTDRTPAEEADHFFRGLRAGDYRLDQLDELVRLLTDDPARRVVLLQAPLHPEYRQAMQERHADALSEFRARVARFEGLSRVEVWLWGDDPIPVGMLPEHFADYGHMTPTGASLFSHALGERLEPVRCAIR